MPHRYRIPMAALPRDPVELAALVRSGDRRAIARAISLVEDEATAAAELVRALWPPDGGVAEAGSTGAPSVGKVALVGALVSEVRRSGRTVGVVAVDPSSPFTQGAALGDRARLVETRADFRVCIARPEKRTALEVDRAYVPFVSEELVPDEKRGAERAAASEAKAAAETCRCAILEANWRSCKRRNCEGDRPGTDVLRAAAAEMSASRSDICSTSTAPSRSSSVAPPLLSAMLAVAA